MKYAIYGMGLFSLVIGFSMMFLVVRTKVVKQEELSVAVGRAMKVAVQIGKNTDCTNQEISQQFCEVLDQELGDKGELLVEIMCVDARKGILRANVTLTFSYINGYTGTVNVDRTVIFDEEWREPI